MKEVHLYKQNGLWHLAGCRDYSAFGKYEGSWNVKKQEGLPPREDICDKCLEKIINALKEKE